MITSRKQGKVPRATRKITDRREYETATTEIQNDAVKKAQRVFISNDLLATGGTAKAAAKLVEKIGGMVAGFAFIIELTDLTGSKTIKNYRYKSLVKY